MRCRGFGRLLFLSSDLLLRVTPNLGVNNQKQFLFSNLAAAAALRAHMSVGLPTQGTTTGTTSYWLQGDANPLAQYGANASFAREDIDVLVIGSGITGVSFVHHLVQALRTEPHQSKPDVLNSKSL